MDAQPLAPSSFKDLLGALRDRYGALSAAHKLCRERLAQGGNVTERTVAFDPTNSARTVRRSANPRLRCASRPDRGRKLLQEFAVYASLAKARPHRHLDQCLSDHIEGLAASVVSPRPPARDGRRPRIPTGAVDAAGRIERAKVL
jgi:hypothetical protein